MAESGDGPITQPECWSKAKDLVTSIVKDDVKTEAFGFTEIPHKSAVRTFLKQTRALVMRCSELDAVSGKLAAIETGVAAAFDVLGVALRENERHESMGAVRAATQPDVDTEARAQNDELKTEIITLKEKLKQEVANGRELTQKLSSQREELLEERARVRAIESRLSETKDKYEARCETYEGELQTLANQHQRELDRQRRKFRQEKADEIDRVERRVTAEANVDRQRSSQNADTFWKTRFESLERDHQSTLLRNSTLKNELQMAQEKTLLDLSRIREEVNDAKAELKIAKKAAATAEKALKTQKKKDKAARAELEAEVSAVKSDLKAAKSAPKTELKSTLEDLAAIKKELAAEKASHDKSKTKFSKVYKKAKDAQRQLMEKVTELQNAQAELRVKLMMSGEEALAAKEETLVAKSEIAKLKFEKMEQASKPPVSYAAPTPEKASEKEPDLKEVRNVTKKPPAKAKPAVAAAMEPPPFDSDSDSMAEDDRFPSSTDSKTTEQSINAVQKTEQVLDIVDKDELQELELLLQDSMDSLREACGDAAGDAVLDVPDGNEGPVSIEDIDSYLDDILSSITGSASNSENASKDQPEAKTKTFSTERTAETKSPQPAHPVQSTSNATSASNIKGVSTLQQAIKQKPPIATKSANAQAVRISHLFDDETSSSDDEGC